MEDNVLQLYQIQNKTLIIKKICRYLKKTLNCGGNVVKDEKLGEII